MKQFFIFLAIWIGWIFMLYICVAFIELNNNPYWWSIWSRIILTVLGALSSFPAGYISERITNEE